MKSGLIKKIILSVVCIVLIVVLAVSNVIINKYSNLIHMYFAGNTTDYSSEEAQNALSTADELVQEIAGDSIVLLKNDNGYLPLQSDTKFNLFGWGSTDHGFLLTGGGSGGTSITSDNEKRVTLTEAFEKAEIEYNTELTEAYNEFSTFDADYRKGGSTGANAVESLKNPGADFYSTSLMESAYAYSKTAVVVLSRWAAENDSNSELVNTKNNEYTNGTFLELTTEEKAMFDALQNYGFEVTVLFNTCNNMEMGFLNEYSCIKAALYIGLPGQSGATSIPKILTGSITPSGKTMDTMAYDYQTNNPSYLNAVQSNSNIVYQEGIYIGYKWYETADVAGYYAEKDTTYDDVVQFPFGYGLSYTEFEWTVMELSWTDGSDMATFEDGKEVEYSITVRVKNVGDVEGKDVVELYSTPPYYEGGIEKASVNLIAFGKTETLEPDQFQDITLTFTAYDLASYDDYDKNGNGHTGYELDLGEYYLKLMTDAHTSAVCYDESGKRVSNEYSLYCESIINYDTDPVTGKTVANRFTGDTAYASMPIDGSTAIAGGIDYLSRANKFANYPTNRASAISNSSGVKTASEYRFDGYDTVDVSSYKYGEDAGMYLVTNEDGSRASSEALSGSDSSASLVFNYELMTTLWNYDAEEWNRFLDQLTQDEINNLIGRAGFQTISLYSVGKPRNQDSDGPAGFNSNVINPGVSSDWTVFPSESLIGCSWDEKLAYNLGRSQGQVAAATNENGWYAPGVNLHRSVYNTRNYEYYSEDGVLSGILAAATIKGAKINNLYCYIKHFVLSEPGMNAKDWTIWITEQALRESYLKPFELAVKEGGANAVMSAFNRLGAVWCGYNHALLTDILRDEWGFKGSVITDWYTSYMSNYTNGIIAGNDIWLNAEQPKSADLNFADTATAYAARQTAKNVLYTYIDTVMTAKNYQDNGGADDEYSVVIGVSVTAEAHSDLFIALWVILDVVLAAGIAVSAVFLVLSFVKKPKAKIKA